MSDWKACLERIEEKVDSNLNRMERMEARLETFGNQLTNIERISSENTQRIIQLENDSCHRRLTKDQVRLKTNSLYCLVLFNWSLNNKVALKGGKLYKIKDKSHQFLSTISIAGIPRILLADISVLRALFAILILTSLLFGFYNIREVVKDYYLFDVITNIKRVLPKTVTFPAITICATPAYHRSRYKTDGTQISEENNVVDKELSMKNFIEQIKFFNSVTQTELTLNISHFEYFKIVDDELLCVRLNGASNRQLDPIQVNRTSDQITVEFNNKYRQIVSETEYFDYTFSNDYFEIFISDNYLNSFADTLPYGHNFGKIYDMSIVKTDIEHKLDEPYNSCRKSSANQNYNKLNCIDGCIYREIRNEFNCTFLNSLFSIEGVRECEDYVNWPDWIKNCEKKCPIGCDSIKFSLQSTIRETFSSVGSGTLFFFSVVDFSSLEITQIPKMNGFSLISNIGGALGLFMGISFLNFIEIFEFIIDIFFLVFWKAIQIWKKSV